MTDRSYVTREVQQHTGVRFDLACFTTLDAAKASAQAYSNLWGVPVEIVELWGILVRVVAACWPRNHDSMFADPLTRRLDFQV